MARHAQSQAQRDRRPLLIVLAMAVLAVAVVGIRVADGIRQLHAAKKQTTTSAAARLGAEATTPVRADPIRHRKQHRRQHRAAPTLATLTTRLDGQVGNGHSVSVAAIDLTSGRRFDYGVTHGMIDASVSKLDVLEALLLHHQQTHTPLTADEDALAAAMIERSDNGAGQSLWDELGYASAIDALNVRLGLRNTVADPAGYYGLTTSCAKDQLTLLDNLTDLQGPLTKRSRTYALGLLGHVESDQRWGVSAAADPGTAVAVKNGWLGIDDDGGRWVVNSDGIVTVSGHQVLLAVMTRHNADEQDGIALVESISREVAAALG